MLVYVAGPYRGDVKQNIANARKVAIELWEKGYNVICPHLNTSSMELDCKMPDGRYLEGDLDMLSRCDAMVILPNSENSHGTQGEIAYCWEHNIPMTFYPELPEIISTEKRSPIQCEAFRNTVMQMYRVHLAKNNDDSPANIMGTGEIGLVTRLWDKIARLMNLIGFWVTISESHFEAPRKPRNESIDDTLMDAAVYSIIGILLRQQKWGR